MDKDVIEYIEEMKMLILDRGNKVFGIVTISKGGTVGTVIDVKVVLQYALKANAQEIILAHAHPSVNLHPSETDNLITDGVKNACNNLDIQFLDYLIISPGKEFRSII